MLLAINKQKNKIILISAFLITLAQINNFTYKNVIISNIFLITASIIGTFPIFLQAFSSLRLKIISIDVLVTVAIIGAFVINNYEEAAIVSFLFLFGAFLEQKTLNKTKNAIKELIDLKPQKALKKVNNDFVLVKINEVEVGDLLLVKTGDQIPVDGIIVKGFGQINQASITGEPIPVEKTINDQVYAGTILENGTLEIETLKIGEDTTFGKIIELVEEASDSKSKTEKFINKFSFYYTPIVLLIALVVGLFTKDIELAITILVLGCPGALVIGVPVSNVSGIGNGARNGVLFKGSEVISALSKTSVLVFDKTGTITTGRPEVLEILYYTKDVDEANKYLYSIEKESNHPLAKAVVNYFDNIKPYDVSYTNVLNGFGIEASINDKKVLVGSLSLVNNNKINITKQIKKDFDNLIENGHTVVFLVIDNEINLILGIKDKIRPNLKNEIINLKKMGYNNLIMLSGDNQKSVDLVTNEIGLTKGIGNMLPSDKVEYVKELKNKGEIVTFIGDGINDSPSIALADVGIAVGSGTDVAINTSDVVLMKSSFFHLRHALGLAKAIIKNTFSNIVIALLVVIILIYGLVFGGFVNMTVGMLVHEGSILLVILNGMRLLKFKLKKENK